MKKQQRQHIQQIDSYRATLKVGGILMKRQEVGGVVFQIMVRVSLKDSPDVSAETLHNACEEMAEYVFYGGMAL